MSVEDFQAGFNFSVIFQLDMWVLSELLQDQANVFLFELITAL